MATITRLATRQAFSPDEIQGTREFWIRYVQLRVFSDEYTQLSNRKSLSKGSRLLALPPYLDPSGLIRVGEWLQHSSLAEEVKHPIVLDSHPLVTLLIRQKHLHALHAGPTLTLRLLRERYWLLRARQTVRAHRCIPCVRERATLSAEFTGQLPPCRVQPSSCAFEHCGLDYAGPILMRAAPEPGHKSYKAYIAVFVCMTVRAVHLELVSDYSIHAFLATFRRFSSRRGVLTNLYSDNATNFQGAQRELAILWKEAFQNVDLNTELAESGTKWYFLPLAAPHFGGLVTVGSRGTECETLSQACAWKSYSYV